MILTLERLKFLNVKGEGVAFNVKVEDIRSGIRKLV